MDFKKYQQEAASTFKPPKELEAEQARLCDWVLGVGSEAGELQDSIKHHVFHEQPLNLMEVVKEVGDVLWYLSGLCETLGVELEDCAELNLAKLRHRHQGRFSFEGSANRREREQKFEDTEEYQRIRDKIRSG